MPKYRHKIQFFARIPCQKTENSVPPLSLPSLPFSAHSVKLSLHSPPDRKSFCQKRFTKDCLRRNSPFPDIYCLLRDHPSPGHMRLLRDRPFPGHMLLSPRSPFSRAYAPPPGRPSPGINAARPMPAPSSRPSGQCQHPSARKKPKPAHLAPALMYPARLAPALIYSVIFCPKNRSRKPPLAPFDRFIHSPSGGTGAKAFPGGFSDRQSGSYCLLKNPLHPFFSDGKTAPRKAPRATLSF